MGKATTLIKSVITRSKMSHLCCSSDKNVKEVSTFVSITSGIMKMSISGILLIRPTLSLFELQFGRPLHFLQSRIIEVISFRIEENTRYVVKTSFTCSINMSLN